MHLSPTCWETFDSEFCSPAIAVFLPLVASFQSVRVALAVVTTFPAVLAGVSLALLVTGSTLNLQSFMGAMMAVGTSVAHSILLGTFAERYRKEGLPSDEAALEGVARGSGRFS